MDATHIHLLLNHAPVAGVAFGLFFLTIGLIKHSESMRLSAMTLFTLSALLVLPVFFTGESAEESVEGLPGVSESIIETHEDSAALAIWGMGALGVVSIVGLSFPSRRQRVPMKLVGAVAVVAVMAMVLIGRTAYLGGQIRHTEIRGTAAAGQTNHEAQGEKGGAQDSED